MALVLTLVFLCCMSSAAQQAESEIPDLTSFLRIVTIQQAKLELEVKNLQTRDAELQQQVTQQQQQLQTQAAELVTMKSKVIMTEEQVEALRKDREVRKVAFFASLVDSGTVFSGPLNINTTLVFKKVIENIGNAYNPETGIFTVPAKGAYHFELHIFGQGNPTHGSGAWLMKNEQYICIAHGSRSSSHVNSSNGATLLLEVGDVVFVRQVKDTKIYDDANHQTTFSGHMLFSM